MRAGSGAKDEELGEDLGGEVVEQLLRCIFEPEMGKLGRARTFQKGA